MRIIKKYKVMYKQSILRKLREQRKINKDLKNKILTLTLAEDLEKKYIDEINNKQREIRKLLLENKKLKGDL